MISFKDRAFCCSDVEEHTCGRELTPELREEYEEWSKDFDGDAPIAYSPFCG